MLDGADPVSDRNVCRMSWYSLPDDIDGPDWSKADWTPHHPDRCEGTYEMLYLMEIQEREDRNLVLNALAEIPWS